MALVLLEMGNKFQVEAVAVAAEQHHQDLVVPKLVVQQHLDKAMSVVMPIPQVEMAAAEVALEQLVQMELQNMLAVLAVLVHLLTHLGVL
jgi:hypothetical protein